MKKRKGQNNKSYKKRKWKREGVGVIEERQSVISDVSEHSHTPRVAPDTARNVEFANKTTFRLSLNTKLIE